MMAEKTRTETDSLGEVEITAEAYWGAQTQRAVDNFTVSAFTIPLSMRNALAQIKQCAAQVNQQLGLLDTGVAEAIVAACGEILSGKLDHHFPVDVFQTGSGTSWNMNMNEVIANRANELLGGKRGDKSPVHPNDHVNRGQSSNDVIPTALSMSNRLEAEKLITVLVSLSDALAARSVEFMDIIKVGRTHLQDAVPITLGQEFSGYATQVLKASERIKKVLPELEDLAIGGTALGTGVNTHKEFAAGMVKKISEYTGIPFREAACKFEAIAARDSQAALAGALNTVVCSLMKIANDLRLLASGPRTGFAEIELPSLQPGSSIMPGKINPVIPEMMIQVCAHIMGKTTSITVACQTGPLDLQIMQPLLAFETLSALEILANAVHLFEQKCIAGLIADKERCAQLVDWSLAMVTPLALKIGYDKASKVAFKAFSEKKTVKEVAIQEGFVTSEEAETVFDPQRMLAPE
ncbi:MAG: class II fumarate hydratase [Spirochaetales bacterium]|nr:class II fumarate hydratase [Spirochaetales bacterium]